jgi:hypothetical protein
MKRIGFLSFGHWRPRSESQTRTAADALLQTIEPTQAAEEIGIDGHDRRAHRAGHRLDASPGCIRDLSRAHGRPLPQLP